MALIATGERGALPAPMVAGRSLVLRQFDFARACGVERVIAYGNGAREDAQALQREAGRARIAHAAVASAHALVAMVDWADELLVLQPGLLPEAEAAIEALRPGGTVLAFPGATASPAGFERIDAGNIWAGALSIPGALVDRLEQLAEDADAHAALLRIALQAHLPVEHLPDDLITDGRWFPVRPDPDPAVICAARLRRLAPARGIESPSRRLARWVLARFVVPLTEHRFALVAGLALALALIAGGLFAAWSGWPASAFAALALAVPVLSLSRLLDRVRRAAFQRPLLPRWLRHLPDVALLATGILTLDGAWYGRLFPPLVLVLALRGLLRKGRWRVVIGDRAGGALAVSGAALAGAQEPALMAWALLAIAAGFASRGDRSRPVV